MEVVYFRPAAGIGRDVVRLFEALGLFREPLAGLEPQLAPVEGALEEIALDPAASLSDARFDALVGSAHEARTRIREAAYQQLHRDPYRPAMAPALLARVPKELDELNQEVVINAAIGLGFTIAHPPGHRVFSIELGSGATVDGLPGVPAGSGYVGTFDREEAVENEFIDFFASGHPLVEGLFAHYEESALGRAVRFEMKMGTGDRCGTDRDLQGRPRVRSGGDRRRRQSPSGLGRGGPEAADRRAARYVGAAAKDQDWRSMVRRLGAQLDPTRRLHAVAAIEVRPGHGQLAAKPRRRIVSALTASATRARTRRRSSRRSRMCPRTRCS